MSSPRVRFAPSPTGHVHIGNIRVAIFNWLYARHVGGQFLLRVEDTDRERSTPEAVQAILDAMDWLGLDVDEAPVYQSKNAERHLAAAERLIEEGRAYRADKGDTGKEAILFRMPERDSAYTDAVKGDLVQKAGSKALNDFVIVRSNGAPVFHLANVVDDIDMGITHVIRGDDHADNSHRHMALYEALGATVPTFAHLPMIVNPQGKPYSKRDGAAFVGDFRANGYLPQALFNYLTLLGWAPGDDRELMTRDAIVEAFDFDGINSSAAQMDIKKLDWMNGEYMRALPVDDFAERYFAMLAEAGVVSDGDRAYSDAVAVQMQERTRLWSDIVPDGSFFFADTFEFDPKAVRKRLQKEGNGERLQAVRAAFAALDTWSLESTETAVQALAEAADANAGVFIHPIRVAVSGLMKGPGVYDILVLLGQDRVVGRLDAALERYFDD